MKDDVSNVMCSDIDPQLILTELESAATNVHKMWLYKVYQIE